MSKHQVFPFFRPIHSQKGKRVYVSGPMTGLDNLNYPAFNEATEALRAMGYSVCSPAETTDYLELGGEKLTHEEFLRYDFERVLEADFMVALPRWERSLGALSEVLVATRIGTKVWAWEGFEDYNRIRYEDVENAIVSQQEAYDPVQMSELRVTTTTRKERGDEYWYGGTFSSSGSADLSDNVSEPTEGREGGLPLRDDEKEFC